MAKRRFRSRGRFTKLRRRRRGGAKRLKKFIKGVVKRMSEIKFRTSGAFNVGFDPYLGAIIEFTPTFPQGTDKYARIGNCIQYKFIKIDETMAVTDGTAAGVSNGGFIRRIIFWPRVPFQGIAIPNQQNNGFIFDDPGVGAWLSTLRTQNIRVVSDKLIYFSTAGQAQNTQMPSVRKWKKRFRCFNKVNFSANTETLPTDNKDKLYVLIVSSSAVNELTCTYSWHTRFSFYDT